MNLTAKRLPRSILVLAVIAAALTSVIVAILIVDRLTAGSDVGRLVEVLEGGGSARWRAAAGLVAALADPHNDAQRRDPAMTRRLIALAQRESRVAAPNDDQVRLQIYSCRLLGELGTSEPLETLTELAATGGAGAEKNVRLAAMESIAVLAGRLGSGVVVRQPQLVSTLLDVSRAADPRLRGTAAFTLGTVDGRETVARLKELLADTAPEVRYNAATALARHGDAACIGVLVEMLAVADVPARIPAQPQAESDSLRMHRETIVINALRATDRLAAANKDADLSQLAAAIQRLYVANIGAATAIQATAALHHIHERATAR